ncbi:MAG: hypothetical protein KGL39_23895 [Patescibacteria group bacterium]|nr:hypothetical protein [Patescibacteria group bacterium]
MTDIAALVFEHQQIKTHLEAQQKVFANYCKPYNERIEQIQAAITATMTEQGIKAFKTDTGTAILSEINTAKIKPDERDAYIDMCLEHWDEFGGEMMQIMNPKAEAVRNYMDAHEGQLPPHIEMNTILRFSIRKA